ncbi:MAG: DNA adenine methylase [Myxococcota bacterium]|nr:DNA adenine methylase [Myxococcota bacterium]
MSAGDLQPLKPRRPPRPGSSVPPPADAPPPLKWAGGKRWLIPELTKLWEPYSRHRLVEPFCGGLGVALSLRPERLLANDINPHLIHFYRSLQKGLKISFAMENDAELFYRHRDRFNALIAQGKSDSGEAAGLFYYLNRTGYNGLCRFNSKGVFNVPFGQYKTINYQRDFSAYKAVLKHWEFTCGQFDSMEINGQDFVYADPPYDVPFTSYSSKMFLWEDQVRLAEWLARLTCPVAASNQATERIILLYRKLGFHIRTLQAPRRINSTGDRTPAREILAVRNL